MPPRLRIAVLETTWLRITLLVVLSCFGPSRVTFATPADDESATDLAGRWELSLVHDDATIRCGLELTKTGRKWTAMLINGAERIPIEATVLPHFIELAIPHYDSVLELDVVRRREGKPIANGSWRKRRGPDEWVQMSARAVHSPSLTKPSTPTAEQFAGRWSVQFSSSDDPAVGIFRQTPDGRLEGTFLTTTGDYRFLSGSAADGTMHLSCFDGAHAFAFEAKLIDDNSLEGDFWSANTWHETFTAKRNDDAALPDSFRQTLVNQSFKLADFEFPDVDGRPVNLDAASFRGKPRLIYLFGSWCPNCHDAAVYLSELERKYADRGLSILGLAFELTGTFERDAEQVRRYLKRHDCRYPVLIAGTADKDKASRTFPLLDRVRSYPTTIFIDRAGKITAVHTGFSGPATGEDYRALKQRFERQIDALLRNQ
ncbi:MAG: TlpA disulfide reductase family protein [Planctomycetota bacterium]